MEINKELIIWNVSNLQFSGYVEEKGMSGLMNSPVILHSVERG